MEGCEDAFFREWRQMINFAWSGDSWRDSPVSSNWDREKLFRHLMGFGIGGSFVEDARFAGLLTTMKPEFERWARHFLGFDSSISSFARFLIHPGAAGLFRAGVEWIAEAVPNLHDSVWREDHGTADALMGLAEFDWSANEAQIRSEPHLRQQIISIVKTMADHQFPRALEFQDRMARSG